MSFAYSHHVDDCNCAQCDRARRAADGIIKAAMEAADREYDRRGGIPLLRSVEVRPPVQPQFSSTRSLTCTEWIERNTIALFDWFVAVHQRLPDEQEWDIHCGDYYHRTQLIEALIEEWAR